MYDRRGSKLSIALCRAVPLRLMALHDVGRHTSVVRQLILEASLFLLGPGLQQRYVLHPSSSAECQSLSETCRVLENVYGIPSHSLPLEWRGPSLATATTITTATTTATNLAHDESATEQSHLGQEHRTSCQTTGVILENISTLIQ